MKKIKLVPVTNELSVTPEQIKAGIDFTVNKWNMLNRMRCYKDLPDSDSGKQLFLSYRSAWTAAYELLETMGLKDAYYDAIRAAREEGDK